MKFTLSFLISLLCIIAKSASAFQPASPPVTSPSAPDPEYSPQGVYTGAIYLPHIVRFQKLPMRMHLDPYIPLPTEVRRLNERFVPLWERVLKEATDAEMQEVAALSLARVAELGLTEISSAGPTLMTVAESTKNNRIRYACAKALASGNIESSAPLLIRLAQEGTDSQRLLIEPALARWKVTSAIELWQPRISDSHTTGISFRLAAEGLAALSDVSSAAMLIDIANASAVDYAKRTAAAHAAAVLDPDRSSVAAESLIKGDVSSRLLGLVLLDGKKVDAPAMAATLCTDSSDGVASAAWLQVFRYQPDLLIQHLQIGCQHRDATVRMTAARVIKLFPDPERIAWLHQQLSDTHIEVRNVARQMLLAVATDHLELKDQIVEQASRMLKPDSSDWQGIEQSLVLLGQLHASQFSVPCFALLDYPKDEVSISAAWLIQLSPDETIREQVRNYIEVADARLANGTFGPDDTALREAMLLQYAGLVRMREIQPLLEQQFSKSAPGTPQKRASALWALGILFEKNPEPSLVGKYEARVKDRMSIPPEQPEVRREAVMALGLLRATTSNAVVYEAYEVDSQESGIAGTARWVLPLIGQPMPADFIPYDAWIGGWRINPVDDR